MKYPRENDRSHDAAQVRQGQMQISKGVSRRLRIGQWVRERIAPDGIGNLTIQTHGLAMN